MLLSFLQLVLGGFYVHSAVFCVFFFIAQFYYKRNVIAATYPEDEVEKEN